MTFKKPDNMSYTDMCIYIDNNVYTENADETTIYEYIYHIVYMLAKQGQLFNKNHYYDDFAIYGANRVYFRLTNPKQWQEKDDGSGFKMDKIKSVLNYIKNILYPLKVDFEQSEYCQVISKDAYPQEVNYNFSNVLGDEIDRLTFCEFTLLFNDIGKTCKAFLQTIPYKSNSSEWLNIYTSVMLTFLNSVTLTNKRKRRLQHLTNTMRLTDNHLIEAYEKENNEVVLFHLDDSMSDYILVLARQLKNLVAKDLTDILHTNVSNEISLLSLAVQDYMDDNNEDINEY